MVQNQSKRKAEIIRYVSNLFTAQYWWPKIVAMVNKGCLKNVTTEKNIAVNHSINLPKSVMIEKIRITKSITKNLIPKNHSRLLGS